ncbi:MAG: helix-turn-helix transcriptional regulator [Alphaproteobacteria bacterium]|nr:helix-turn-helix transcriptional regulator [Alphaproteobacteria bacterium]
MDYNKYYIQVREKLDHLIRTSSRDDYASVSALIGKNHAYMQQFIKRGVPKCLKEDDMEKIINHFHITMDYFGSPDDFINPDQDDSNNPETEFDQDYIRVNVYDIEAAAGAGSVVEKNDVANKLAFKKTWIRSSSNATADDMAVITVSGDSMNPTLYDGDHILVDMTLTSLKNDGIYVLRNDDMILVKRISLNPVTKLCTIKSDNSFYESWQDCHPADLDILGRVIWMGRNI